MLVLTGEPGGNGPGSDGPPRLGRCDRCLLQLQRLLLDSGAAVMPDATQVFPGNWEGTKMMCRAPQRRHGAQPVVPSSPTQGHTGAIDMAAPTLSPAQSHLPQEPSPTLLPPQLLSLAMLSLSFALHCGPPFSAKVTEDQGEI